MLASYVMELAYNLKNCAALGTRQQHGGLPEVHYDGQSNVARTS